MIYFYCIKTRDYMKIGHTKNLTQRFLSYKKPIKVIFTKKFYDGRRAMHFELWCLKLLKLFGAINILGEFFVYEENIIRILINKIKFWRYYIMGKMKFDSAFEVKE